MNWERALRGIAVVMLLALLFPMQAILSGCAKKPQPLDEYKAALAELPVVDLRDQKHASLERILSEFAGRELSERLARLYVVRGELLLLDKTLRAKLAAEMGDLAAFLRKQGGTFAARLDAVRVPKENWSNVQSTYDLQTINMDLRISLDNLCESELPRNIGGPGFMSGEKAEAYRLSELIAFNELAYRMVAEIGRTEP